MNNEDMSDILNKINNMSGQNNISPDMVNNLFNMLNNSNTSSSDDSSTQSSASSNQESSSNASSNIDFETIMKMKTIIDKMNSKDDPRSNLLKSLKPYLNESRKGKVDQYIQLMNMSKAIDVFPFMGGGKNNDK